MWMFYHISRIHITAIAFMGVLTFGWLFSGTYFWLLALVCALDWYIINLENKITDIEEDQANLVKGTTFVLGHRRQLFWVMISILLISIVVVHMLNPAITGLRILVHILGMLYSWPLLPRKRRLKELYFWKNTASAFGFLITVFGYPLATIFHHNPSFQFPEGISWMTVLFLGLFFFLFEVSYEIIYDLRDINGDRLALLKTYPVVHGQAKAVYLIDILLLSSMLTLGLGYFLHVVPWRILIMAGAPLLQFTVYKRALPKGISSKDCIMITWLGVSMLVVYHLWALADLPGTNS